MFGFDLVARRNPLDDALGRAEFALDQVHEVLRHRRALLRRYRIVADDEVGA